MYSKIEKAEIGKTISDEILKTKNAIAKYRELTKPISPENAIGRVSRMDAINNKSVNESTLKQAELKLKQLQIAQSRLEDPDFGICRICKNQIPIGRILLLPQTNTCVNCAARG